MSEVSTRLSAALRDRYTIERELGAGGMATVYLAHDIRHDRKVALKVLRPELSAILGGERFLAEIKTTANLQHPHILSLFDSGSADELVFYVMPFVEGESLRERLHREHQLPVEDAVRIAREVADALQYAHQHGIVHRDIKPENILLHGGHALVADFGIALAASRSDSGTRMTETGMSLGTPHYMAPEQAMGEREITPRADIYALGCVLYEMLTGEPPFTGPTAQAIVARVMTEQPRSLTLQRRSIPPNVEAAVTRTLEKLPADRFQSAAQFAEALANPAFVAERGATAARAVAAPGRWTGGRTQLAASPLVWGALAVTAAAGAVGWLRSRPAPPPPPVARFTVTFPRNAEPSDAAGSSIAVSPDGSRLVYVGSDSQGVGWLFLRPLDRLDPVVIPGTRAASEPFFSPDGQSIGFVQDNKLRKVSLSGGPVATVCDAPLMLGASWGGGDVIVYSAGNRLFRVSAAGGQPQLLAADSSVGFRWPELLPDGRAALFTQVRGFAYGYGSGVTIGAISLTDGRIRPLGQPGMSPRYLGGVVVFAQSDGTLVAAPFDGRALSFTGPAQPVAENVGIGAAAVAKFGISNTGTLAYLTGGSLTRQLVLVDRRGAAQPMTTEVRGYESPRISPDSRRIAVDVAEGGGTKLWVWDIAQRTLTPVSDDNGAVRPVWTPDGRQLVYTRRDVGDIYRVAADGSAPPESVLVLPGQQFGDGVTPDGRAILYHEYNPFTSKNDILFLRLDSARTPRVFLKTPADEFGPAISPDGRWLAYASDESGRPEVYVRAFPAPAGKVQISLDGGVEARWSRDGREIFYRNGDRMMAAEVSTRPTFGVAKRTELFRGAFGSNQYHAQYDVMPDGRHFVMTQGPTATGDMIVVLHWFDQLRGRQPGGASAPPAR